MSQTLEVASYNTTIIDLSHEIIHQLPSVYEFNVKNFPYSIYVLGSLHAWLYGSAGAVHPCLAHI